MQGDCSVYVWYCKLHARRWRWRCQGVLVKIATRTTARKDHEAHLDLLCVAIFAMLWLMFTTIVGYTFWTVIFPKASVYHTPKRSHPSCSSNHNEQQHTANTPQFTHRCLAKTLPLWGVRSKITCFRNIILYWIHQNHMWLKWLLSWVASISIAVLEVQAPCKVKLIYYCSRAFFVVIFWCQNTNLNSRRDIFLNTNTYFTFTSPNYPHFILNP